MIKSNCRNCYDRNWLIECKCGCGGLLFRRDKQRRLKQYINNHANKGNQNPMWKGGRYKSGEYWLLRMPNLHNSNKRGYIPEHIYFFQEYHKCCLLKWGVVHHIDEHKENNMPWNLQGMMKKEHSKYHFKKNNMIQYTKKDMSNRRCNLCNNITQIDKKGYFRWYKNRNGKFTCQKCYLLNKYYLNKAKILL